jgi:hypothetical protein
MLTQSAADPATHLVVGVPDSPRGEIRKVRSNPLAIPRRAHPSYHRDARFRLRSTHPPRRRVFLLTLSERGFRPQQSSSWPELSARSFHLIAAAKFCKRTDAGVERILHRLPCARAASRNGSDSVAPRPRRTVRRSSDLRVMIFYSLRGAGSRPAQFGADGAWAGRERREPAPRDYPSCASS